MTIIPDAKATVTAPAAAGGGDCQVWVNKKSKVHHRKGSKVYKKTQVGHYMSEADAKVKGDHTDHGKACSEQLVGQHFSKGRFGVLFYSLSVCPLLKPLKCFNTSSSHQKSALAAVTTRINANVTEPHKSHLRFDRTVITAKAMEI